MGFHLGLQRYACVFMRRLPRQPLDPRVYLRDLGAGPSDRGACPNHRTPLAVTFWQITSLIAAVGLSIWVVWQVILPFRRARAALRGIVEGDYSPVLLLTGFKPIRGLTADLQRLAERMGGMDRQLADEGFSLRAILSSMVEGVLIVDNSQRVKLANSALLRVFGLAGSPLNRTVMEVFRSHDLQNAVSATLQDSKPQTKVLQIDTSKGREYQAKYFEVTAVAVSSKEETEPMGAIVVFHDVTEIKALEEIQRELVENVSHELRTPLSIMIGYVETLMDGAISDPDLTRKFLLTMHKHGVRLNLLLEDLLSISQLEAGTAPFSFKKLDLRQCLDRVIDRLEPQVAEIRAEIRCELEEDLPLIEADAHRLDQVLFNLLDNALKYTVGKSTTVTVVARRSEGDVTVRVTDQGPGIPLDDQPRIFERFYRVHKDRSREAGGIGLGLSIVKQIIEAHGGQVGVDSTPGSGATFHFTLPISQGRDPVMEASQVPGTPAT